MHPVVTLLNKSKRYAEDLLCIKLEIDLLREIKSGIFVGSFIRKRILNIWIKKVYLSKENNYTWLKSFVLDLEKEGKVFSKSTSKFAFSNYFRVVLRCN